MHEGGRRSKESGVNDNESKHIVKFISYFVMLLYNYIKPTCVE